MKGYINEYGTFVVTSIIVGIVIGGIGAILIGLGGLVDSILISIM